MKQRKTGTYERTTVGGEEVAAFIPAALPPTRPKLAIEGSLDERLRAAEQALVRLRITSYNVCYTKLLRGRPG